NCFVESSDATEAAVWFIESTDVSNQYKIYTVVNDVQNYMRNTSENYMGLTTDSDEATAFDLTNAADYKFYFKKNGANQWLQHSNGGGGIRLYTDNNNATNCQISIGLCLIRRLRENLTALTAKLMV
ncbi:MAG: hypothetical protein IJH38_03065, partial [Clostridia bacterium]|nr:hypothetical protein [Clostridia bacterium]